MRILVSGLSARSGGALAYLQSMVPALLAENSKFSGNELKFVIHDDQRKLLGDVKEKSLVTVTSSRKSGVMRPGWERKIISDAIAECRSEVVFTPYQVAAFYPGVRNVTMIRNLEPFLYSQYRYSLQARIRNKLLFHSTIHCLQRSSRVIAVSNFAAQQLELAMRSSKPDIRNIYHGRSEKFAPIASKTQDRLLLSSMGVEKKFLLTCGSMLPYRRCEDVVAAFRNLAKEIPEAQLVIAGSGTDSRYAGVIRNAITKSGVSDRILQLGHVSSDAMASLYRQSSACIIATEIEACPNIVIEAMTAGCAIISSNKDPLPEILDGASIEYNARNVDSLAEAILFILRNPEEQKLLRNKAMLRASNFCWQKCARETYKALSDW